MTIADNLRARYLSKSTPMNYNVGLDWNAARWLHPYVNFSDSVMPPYVANRTDPLGNSPGAAKGIGQAEQVQGKELSYNNLNDTDAAFECVAEFDRPAIVIVKHANPCGVAVGSSAGASSRFRGKRPLSFFASPGIAQNVMADVPSRWLKTLPVIPGDAGSSDSTTSMRWVLSWETRSASLPSWQVSCTGGR